LIEKWLSSKRQLYGLIIQKEGIKATMMNQEVKATLGCYMTKTMKMMMTLMILSHQLDIWETVLIMSIF
jgi:hypothetical protein